MRRRTVGAPYNGFTPEERMVAGRLIHAAIAQGIVARPKTCSICGTHSPEGNRLAFHLEDYRKPLSFHGLCRKCHYYLHTRFRHPSRWIALIEDKPRDWFHDLVMDEASRTRSFDETYSSKLTVYKPTLVENTS